MIIFHEGLPGSGKSYEAVLEHILPALKQGRDVITNINGINFEAFSASTNIPLPIILMLMTVINHLEIDDLEQRYNTVKSDFIQKTKKDSLVVIDEVQNLWPTTRQKENEAVSKYVSEHRHEGLDIVLMGQDRRDVHTIWRRRINRLLTFNKLQAVGLETSYRWECFEATAPEKFSSVSSGVRKYEKSIFDLYSSHTAGTANKSVYKDNRANIFRTKNFIYGVIGLFFVIWFGGSAIADFFSPDVPQAPVSAPAVSSPVVNPPPPSIVVNEPKTTESPPQSEPGPLDNSLDIFDEQTSKGRLRLAAILWTDQKIFFRIEIIDGNSRVIDAYDYATLIDLGWTVERRVAGVVLTKQNKQYIARAWPLERSPHQVDRRTVESL
jgi:zona occludens toxin